MRFSFRHLLIVFLAILCLIAVVLLLAGSHRPDPLPLNALAIGDRAKVESLDVVLQPLIDLDFKTKSDVVKLRTEAVAQYPELLAGTYRPSDEVFGQIVDGLPWWGVLGAYYYGKGKLSIAGPSLHSQSIVNPYLIVVPDFGMRWHRSDVEGIDEQTVCNRLYCFPRNLRWYPKIGRVEVSYEAPCILRNRAGVFSLSAFNARDLGLQYIYVSYPRSRNIFKQKSVAHAYRNPQFIHRGGSCGYPGGCNNMSPRTPPLDDIFVSDLPCKVVVHLWERQPRSVDERPDIEYVMNFE